MAYFCMQCPKSPILNLDLVLPDHSQLTDNITRQRSTWHQTTWSTWQQTMPCNPWSLCHSLVSSHEYSKVPIYDLTCILYLFFNITMTPGTVDYDASYFKYKTPTPIHGTPTNTALKPLKVGTPRQRSQR